MRDDLLKASELHFKAHIEKHRINVENPDIMDTIEKELELISEYDDKLNVLKKYFKKNKEKEVLNG